MKDKSYIIKNVSLVAETYIKTYIHQLKYKQYIQPQMYYNQQMYPNEFTQ